jgi:hypothetical protein
LSEFGSRPARACYRAAAEVFEAISDAGVKEARAKMATD